MNERALMWFNMLWNLPLGATVQTNAGSIWQKRGRDCWMTVGSSSEYDTTSVPWPISRVLIEGVEL